MKPLSTLRARLDRNSGETESVTWFLVPKLSPQITSGRLTPKPHSLINVLRGKQPGTTQRPLVAGRFAPLILMALCLIVFSQPPLAAENALSGFDLEVKELAVECRDEVIGELELLLETNRLSFAQLFDTFYIPIPNTSPQKYKTQYDHLTDKVLRIILDKYLDTDKRLLFVVAVDKNGYLPTHNARYSRPLTDDPDYNAKNNRTKRLFNDRTGLAAARNTKPHLLQQYERDTGETLFDLSVPIIIRGKHWGGLRIGYRK